MRRLRIILPLIALMLIVPAVPQTDAKNSFNFFLGLKNVDDLSKDETGADLDNQFDVGVEMSFGGNDWPVMIAVDLLGSWKDDSFTYEYYYGGYYYLNDYDVSSSTQELDVGIRKTWEFATNPTRPYIGGGVAGIRGSVNFDVSTPFDSFSVDDDGFGFGYWIGGGVYWKLGQKFNLGLNLRYSTAKVDFDKFDVTNIDVGGTHAGVILGWGF